MNTTLTFTFTHTNTFTNSITNTNTHTNFPLRKSLLDKALQECAVRKSHCNFRTDDPVDFNHISYLPTLPDRLILPGRTPFSYMAKQTLTEKKLKRT